MFNSLSSGKWFEGHTFTTEMLLACVFDIDKSVNEDKILVVGPKHVEEF